MRGAGEYRNPPLPVNYTIEWITTRSPGALGWLYRIAAKWLFARAIAAN